MFEIRTDLAVEEKESFPGNGGEVGGVSLKEWKRASGNIKLTEVVILDGMGAKAMGKPKGTYVTIEADDLGKEDEAIVGKIYSVINQIAEEKDFKKDGYRVIVNCGKNGGQEVMHLHFHVLAGKQLGEKIV